MKQNPKKVRDIRDQVASAQHLNPELGDVLGLDEVLTYFMSFFDVSTANTDKAGRNK